MQVCDADFIRIRQATKICMRAECRICVIKGRFCHHYTSPKQTSRQQSTCRTFCAIATSRCCALMDIEFVGPVAAHLYISLHALPQESAYSTAACKELQNDSKMLRTKNVTRHPKRHACIYSAKACVCHACSRRTHNAEVVVCVQRFGVSGYVCQRSIQSNCIACELRCCCRCYRGHG